MSTATNSCPFVSPASMLVSLAFSVSACAAPASQASLAAAPAPQEAVDDPASAFQALVESDHWRKRNAARDRLMALGPAALDTVLAGTTHADDGVRLACHEVLRERFPTDERAVDAFLAGLQDANVWWIAYPSAFHLGEQRVERAREALHEVLADTQRDELVRYAAAKSLAELGEQEMIVCLWQGLGSEHAYTRYLSNLGLVALTDRDLTAFAYEGPWEGAFVSGPAVGSVQGQPIEKAEKRVRRWQAIVDFTRWLQDERPQLFAELEQKLW